MNEVLTDYKPLLGLFGKHKAIPHMTSSRIQQWYVTVSAYDYILEFRNWSANSNASSFSQLLLSDVTETVPTPEDICLVDYMNGTTANISDIRKCTRLTPVISTV